MTGARPAEPRVAGSPSRPIRTVGDRAHLVEVAGNEQVHLVAAAVRQRFGERIEDVVPGEETVLLCWRGSPPGLAELTAEIATLVLTPPAAAGAAPIPIPVRYDGADLDTVAAIVGVDVERLVELHTQPEYLVAFMGFAPGFAYLTGGSPALHIPRRDEPRRRVPAGSVAVASAYSAVYPVSAPGGWHLLGHTDAVLFDADRRPPALLEAGATVVFEPQ